MTLSFKFIHKLVVKFILTACYLLRQTKYPFLVVILFLSVRLISQNSYIVVEAQYDQYGDDESQLNIYNSNDEVILNHTPTTDNEYFIDTLLLDSGSYYALLSDTYGDGWYWNIEGFLRISNQCQGTIVDFLSTNSNPFYEETIDFEVSPCSLYSPPTSDFSVSSNYNCSGTVSFFDLSSSNTTNWLWDFGDGNISMEQNPQHTYTSSGIFNVQLISSNDYGSDTSFYESIIEINLSTIGPIQNSCSPQTQFPGSLDCGITFFQFGNFSNSSSNSISGFEDFTCQSINLFVGEFYTLHAIHDGNILQNFSVWIDYNNNGEFDLPSEEVYLNIAADSSTAIIQIPNNVTLETALRLRIMAENTFQGGLTPCTNPINGQAEDYSVIFTVNESPPITNFESDKYLTCDGVIYFNDLSSNVPYSWNWDFGDGNTSQLQNPVHIYSENGVYDVTLITTNNYGSDTLYISQLITVDSSNLLNPASCSPNTVNHFDDYGILNVEFANINNSSVDGEEGYVDFSCYHQANVEIGQNYSLNVSTGIQNPHDTRAWIDFNDDGYFTDDELVMEELNTINPQVNVEIPNNIISSPIRLRVLSDLVGAFTNTCVDVSSGQVEDYGVNVDFCSYSQNNNIVNVTKSFCERYIFNGDTLYSPGIYYDTLTNYIDCDSIIKLTLIVDTTNISYVDSIFICQGDSITWIDGYTYHSANNSSSISYTTETGCDSTVFLNLTTLDIGSTLSFSANQTEGIAPLEVIFENQTPNLSSYNFSWDFGDGTVITNNANTVTHTFSSPGFWTVTLFAENINTGCKDSLVKSDYILSILSSDPCIANPLNMTFDLDNLYDCQENNVNLNAVVDGGHMPYTYLWSSGDTAPSISVISNGEYSIQVIDSLGCITLDSVVIEEPFPLQVTLEGNNLSSCISQNGSIISNILGGVPPYSFNWSTGQTSQNLELLDAGIYMLNVLDSIGCSASNQYEIFSPLAPQLEFIVENDNDCEISNVSIFALVDENSTYYYEWSSGQNTPSIENLSSGNFTVEVTDSLGCNTIDSIYVEESIPPTIELTGLNPSECGSNDGAINTFIIGGTPPFSFEWNNGQSSQNLEFLQSGEYVLTFQDDLGCVIIQDYELISPELPSLELVSTNNSSCEVNDAYAYAVASGGSGFYSYLWSNGEEDSLIDELSSGIYSVVVTDELNCSVTGFTNIVALGAPIINITSENVSCFGSSDGYIYASASGGVEPYLFQWENGSTDSIQSGLSEGEYFITITDGNSCEVTEIIYINSPDSIDVTLTSLDLNCYGDLNGSIESDINGGILPYSYLWSNGSESPNINNLTSGQYSLLVTDSTGCSVSESIFISEPDSINITFNISNEDCNPNNQSIETEIEGGTPPYDYIWNNNETSSNIYNLSSDYYVLTITDFNNCISTKSDSVVFFDELQVEFNIINESCLGTGDGIIETFLIGGLHPYTFNWSNGESSQNIQNLFSGDYELSITDFNDCTLDTTLIVINENLNPQTTNIIGNAQVQISTQYQYSVSQSLGSTYYWSIENGAIVSGQGNNSVIVQWIDYGEGVIYVTEKNDSGCFGDTISLSVSIGSTNIQNDEMNKNISLYPIPASDILNIEIDNFNIKPQINLYDLNGKLLQKFNDTFIDLNNYAKGIYYIKISFGNKSTIEKFIKS